MKQPGHQTSRQTASRQAIRKPTAPPGRPPVSAPPRRRGSRLIVTVLVLALALGPVPAIRPGGRSGLPALPFGTAIARADANTPFAILFDRLLHGQADAREKQRYHAQLKRAIDLGRELDRAQSGLATAIGDNEGTGPHKDAPIPDFPDESASEDLPPRPWTWLMHAKPVPPALPWEPAYQKRYGLHARYCEGYLLVWIDPGQQIMLDIPADMIQDPQRYNWEAWKTHARGALHEYPRRDLILGPGPDQPGDLYLHTPFRAGAQRRLRIGNRWKSAEGVWAKTGAAPEDYKKEIDLPDCLNKGPSGPLPIGAVARGSKVYDATRERFEHNVLEMRWIPCRGATHPLTEDENGWQKAPPLCEADWVDCSGAKRADGTPSYGTLEERDIPHEYDALEHDHGITKDPATIPWTEVMSFCVPDEHYEVMATTPCNWTDFEGKDVKSQSLWRVPVTVTDGGKTYYRDKMHLVSSACDPADILVPEAKREVTACADCTTSEDQMQACPSGYKGSHLKRRTRTCETSTVTWPWDPDHPVTGSRCEKWSGWQIVGDGTHFCRALYHGGGSGGGSRGGGGGTWYDTTHDGFADTRGISPEGPMYESDVQGGSTPAGASHSRGYSSGGDSDYGGGSYGDDYGGGSHSSTCFIAGTPVRMGDGSLKPIEAILPGDQVMSFDAEGQLQIKPVTGLIRGENEKIAEINGLFATPLHRFLTDRGGFRRISALTLADQLVDETGSPVAITTLRRTGQRADVYNIEVADLHCYIAGGYRVHNWK